MQPKPFPNRPPGLRQLKSWSQEISEEVWEISVPSKSSLIWSITLAYILSMEKENVSQQFELLLGKEEEIKEVMKKKKSIKDFGRDWEKIRRSVLNFNPFKNRHAFFHNQTLTDIRRILDLRVNRFAQNVGKDLKWGHMRKLEALSIMLKCRIWVCETDQEGNRSLHSFPKETEYKSSYKDLVLFQSSGVARTENIDDVFAFGMSKRHSSELRSQALRYILKKAKVDNLIITDIMKDFNIDDFFLYYLLTSSRQQIVPILLKSPYIALKLVEAGFNLNPLETRNSDGRSVFYHCFHPESEAALESIYDYATNNSYVSNETTRAPGPEILTALDEVSKLIRKDIELGLQDESLTISSCKLKFNEYQRDVVEGILAINDETAPENRTEKVLNTLLNHYSKYFSFNTDEEDPLDYSDFVQYRSYYENLDSFTCLIIYDVILKLSKDSDILKNTALDVFFTVLSYKTFPMCSHATRNVPCDLKERFCGLLFVAFDSRRKFLESTREFLREVEAKPSKKSTGKEKIEPGAAQKKVKERVMALQRKIIPAVKDDVHLDRLKKLLETAIQLPWDEKMDSRSMLVIERTLQVVGECLTPGQCIFRVLLASCISQDATDVLIKLRNLLSHAETPNRGLGKLEMEKRYLKDVAVLSDLSDFFVRLNENFGIVYDVLEFERGLMLLERSKEGDCEDPRVVDRIRQYSDRICEVKKLPQEKLAPLVLGVLDYFLGSMSKGCKKVGKLAEVKALEFLYRSLPLEERERNELLRQVSEIKEKATLSALSNEDRSLINDIFQKQRDLIVNKFYPLSMRQNTPSAVFILKSDCEKLGKSDLLDDDDLISIKRLVENVLKESDDAKEWIRRHESELKRCDCPDLTKNDFLDRLNAIDMMEKNRQTIRDKYSENPEKALSIFKKSKYFKLEDILGKSHTELITILKRKEFVKFIKSDSFPKSLRERLFDYFEWRADFLIDRIGHIKQILIDEDQEIKDLYNWGKSDAIKKHTRLLMCLRYLKDWEVRAALDTLLLDCYNALPNRNDLKQLWEKAERMLSGIDMRDVLAHGNVFLMTLGKELDVEDFPSELINKMLELIDDLEAIKELKKLSNGEVSDLKAVVESKSEGDASVRNVRKCEKWLSYLYLFDSELHLKDQT